jgi:hypothetical protein
VLADDTSAGMGGTTRERYAVVSCHVERPLDDHVWARFSALQQRRPGGFAIAALLRPPDPGAGEDEERWLERAREAVARGPLGHHTHWTAPDHARPTSGGTGEQVSREGRRLRELGLGATAFCGGGWYTDPEVAEACAELGYIDCTPRASRPSYLPPGERWAALAEPAYLRLASGRRLLAIPTTHSLGDLVRALLRLRRWRRMRAHGELPWVVHVYFHDTDLVDRRRRMLVVAALRFLAMRAVPIELDALAASLGAEVPEIPWNDVART